MISNTSILLFYLFVLLHTFSVRPLDNHLHFFSFYQQFLV